MGKQENIDWHKLDNAAKAFPPTVKKSDTRVFRFSCELFDEIDEKTLQFALDKAVLEFPHLLSVMRKGLFWYYLEQCNIKPIVSPESKMPCSQLYKSGYKTLLFEVTYFRNRINLEIFHSLADGLGGIQFFQTIVLKYIIEKYKSDFGENVPFLNNNSSVTERGKDSFFDYYKKDKNNLKIKKEKAYIFRGAKREDDSVIVIEGRLSVKAVLELAHKYNTTLTAFLISAFIYSVGKEMTEINRKLPVVIDIPVNLRKYFSSQTTRNFFAMISIKYTFKEKNDSFETIIKTVSEEMKNEITKERLSHVMKSFAKLEHNPVIRVVPLPIKNFAISAKRNNMDKYGTTVVSNIGAINMPEAVRKYIRSFSVISSTLSTQLCVCSFEDNLELGFTSAFIDTERQKNFFRTLTDLGLDVEIFCNDFNGSRGDKYDEM